MKDKLAKRVGYLCSICEVSTSGPSDETSGSVNNIGVAAHIAAAAGGPGARRYDASMTPAERSSIENGIWLCQSCSKKIDGDAATYTVAALLELKKKAESTAKKRHGRKMASSEGNDSEIKPVLHGASFDETHRAVIVCADIENVGRRSTTVGRVSLEIAGRIHQASSPPQGIVLHGRDWFKLPVHRLRGNDFFLGAWHFGFSFPSGGERIELPIGTTEAVLRLSAAGGNDQSIHLRIERAYVQQQDSVVAWRRVFGFPDSGDE
ncbi:hypothetical protein [Corallococcus sp. AS-1-12]|uniref:hypothetical protein n=1 Tax=Corallococcus sp. AS-1-12 TaxID=2874598 RepID=UPI001CBE82E8|nr:hypothetical protein [Corallococcus sp. AS-1-12]MBZ4336435.1 hypothetical protein [Corallococcus sp. AS-1-12]